MKPKLLVTLAAFAALTAAALAGGAGDDDKKFEGSWVATAVNFKGKAIPEDAVKKLDLTVTFAGGKFSGTAGGKKVLGGTYKLDAKNKTIDLKHTEGQQAGKDESGLYKLQGDTLVMALPADDAKDRPKNFEPAEGSEVTTFKRQEKK